MRLSFAIACLAIAASHARAQAPEPPPAVKARCATCHGEKGETVSEDFPRLAGQHETYLEKQLRDFQSGARKSVMNRLARGLSAEEIVAAAALLRGPAGGDASRRRLRNSRPWGASSIFAATPTRAFPPARPAMARARTGRPRFRASRDSTPRYLRAAAAGVHAEKAHERQRGHAHDRRAPHGPRDAGRGGVPVVAAVTGP